MSSGADRDDDASAPSGSGSALVALARGSVLLLRGVGRIGGRVAQSSLQAAERRALTMLKRKLDTVGTAGLPAPLSPAAGRELQPLRETEAAPLPRELERLLQQALEQTGDQARERLNRRILRQLVPDEARILAALADGHAVPLCHLMAANRLGVTVQPWLENLSSIGKEAGISVPAATPHYVAHLREIGLLVLGPEEAGQELAYQLIESEAGVRAQCQLIEQAGLRPRFTRRSLRISEFGRQWWSACQPHLEPGGRT